MSDVCRDSPDTDILQYKKKHLSTMGAEGEAGCSEVERLAVVVSIHSFNEADDKAMPLTAKSRSPPNTPAASFGHGGRQQAKPERFCQYSRTSSVLPVSWVCVVRSAPQAPEQLQQVPVSLRYN